MAVRITLVTAVLNRREFLRQALQSARDQAYPDLQHIVIDGGSTDGTLDVIRDFPHVEWLSEPDVNFYDSWNKGVQRATGEVIGILNSDDVLLPGALETVARLAREHPSFEMLVGGVEMEHVRDGAPSLVRVISDPGILDLKASNLVAGTPYTNARFLRRSVYDRLGLYDIRFPVCADSEFLMRCLLDGVRAATTIEPIYRFRAHPGSLTISQPEKGSLRVASEVHAMVLARLATTDDAEERRAYLRWHSWIAPYRAALMARHGDRRAGAALLWEALKIDPLLGFRLLPITARHMIDRSRRHGVQVRGSGHEQHV